MVFLETVMNNQMHLTIASYGFDRPCGFAFPVRLASKHA